MQSKNIPQTDIKLYKCILVEEYIYHLYKSEYMMGYNTSSMGQEVLNFDPGHLEHHQTKNKQFIHGAHLTC